MRCGGSHTTVDAPHLKCARFARLAVVRFMRFGVTSVTGLIAGLLSPFAAFLRTPTLTAIGGVLLVSFLAFIYLTLQGMQSQVTFPGAPSGAGIMSAQEVPMEPSMKRMMNDIYGEEQ